MHHKVKRLARNTTETLFFLPLSNKLPHFKLKATNKILLENKYETIFATRSFMALSKNQVTRSGGGFAEVLIL